MSEHVLAAQLYTVREQAKTPEGIAEALSKVRKIGYRAVQVSGLGPIEPQRLKDLVDREGLVICATHIKWDRLRDDLDNVIAEHRLWGCAQVGLGAMPERYRSGEEGFRTFVREIAPTARRLADAGLTLIYHNHDFEFVRFGGKTGMEILIEEFPPEADFEIDVYWVQAGGGDPALWIRKVAGRMKVVHLKDMAMNFERRHVMAEVGEGNLDWPRILEACRDAGVRWYAVEQDICPGDPFESLAVSYRNAVGLGLS